MCLEYKLCRVSKIVRPAYCYALATLPQTRQYSGSVLVTSSPQEGWGGGGYVLCWEYYCNNLRRTNPHIAYWIISLVLKRNLLDMMIIISMSLGLSQIDLTCMIDSGGPLLLAQFRAGNRCKFNWLITSCYLIRSSCILYGVKGGLLRFHRCFC